MQFFIIIVTITGVIIMVASTDQTPEAVRQYVLGASIINIGFQLHWWGRKL